MTKRRNVVWWTAVGAALAVTIGVLGILHGLEPDPDAIKADFAARLAALEAMTAQDAVRRDAIAEELLAVEDYRRHARSLWLKLERLHPKFHEAAALDRAAQKAVTPFLARCRDVSGLPLEELQLCAGDGRSLLGNYGATRFATPLQEAFDRIARRIEALEKAKKDDLAKLLKRDPEAFTPETVYVEVQRRVQALVKAGRSDAALDLIVEFESLRYGGVFPTKTRELREYVERNRVRPR